MSLPDSPEAWARLGARIRAERERQGMSRKVLAERAGISTGSIQTAEKGTVPKGRWPQTLSSIEEALGWASGSRKAILDGGEPSYVIPIGSGRTRQLGDVASDYFDLTHHGQPKTDDESGQSVKGDLQIGLPGIRGGGRAVVGEQRNARLFLQREMALQGVSEEDLPAEVRRALPQVVAFVDLCSGYGYPGGLSPSFFTVVTSMLKAVAKRHERADNQVTEVTEDDYYGIFDREIQKAYGENREEFSKALAQAMSRELTRDIRRAFRPWLRQGDESGEYLLTIGEQLRAARLEQRMSIDDASEAGAISPQVVVALEADDFPTAVQAAAPPGTGQQRFRHEWAMESIKRFAQAVRLDPEPLIEQYEAEMMGREE